MQLELLNFPVGHFLRALQHAAAVQRELDVLRVDDAATGRVPRRIDDVVADLLDEVDAYCESGEQLLTIVTPPDLREFRTWLFQEVLGQLRGAPPTPWREPTAAPSEDDTVAPRSNAAPIVLREHGSLDLADAARVREMLQAAFVDGDGDVILDLSDVDFLDSVILSVFVTAHKRFADDARRLSFEVPPDLLRVFELTGLVGVLDVRPA